MHSISDVMAGPGAIPSLLISLSSSQLPAGELERWGGLNHFNLGGTTYRQMGRGSRRGGRGGGGHEDQFGEAMRSQDRQDHSGSAGRGSASAGGGGGDAGDMQSFCLGLSDHYEQA